VPLLVRARVYPNDRGSRVYPNGRDSGARPGRGSRVCPNGRAAGRGLVGAGGLLGLRPRGSEASPSHATRAHRSRYALTVQASPSPKLNKSIYYVQEFIDKMNSYVQKVNEFINFERMNSYNK